MAAISPNADGVLDVRENNSEQIASAIHQAVATALEEIGLAAERFAKRACPVDTGRLRNSITHALNMDEEAVYIGTNVEYAAAHEFGTSRGLSGLHYLQKAASGHTDEYKDLIKNSLENA
jgi:phage gpG-like protein